MHNRISALLPEKQQDLEMAPASLVRKFELCGILSSCDRDMMTRLLGPPKTVNRHAVIRRENDPVTGAYLLVEGWVSSSTLRNDGGVFISHFYLPGDIVGASSLAHCSASDTLTALSPTVVAPLSKARLGDLFVQSPRLAAVLYLDAMREAVAFADRMAAVARSSAESRVAALLLDLFDRACTIDAGQADLFDFPLTQQDIGDALGLTSVHVSRMMRGFIDRAWIRRSARAFIVKDAAALRALAGIPRRLVDTGGDWLPATR
ncbi:Crp/Fnr family transcriptional regulator [Sphingomonas panacisoli]|uniref:Crp/Fnr family transcriptional regulator n=1 Tax=Sphingomonas panacisoli TaxID=1813879 RepID=A0A5B8LF60_9SPHN|nr:Crp/Fnr family transcriptional regulator [Sphingomonas panacisoli]QDZ06827.1 Crp/Fnr family transcriptional regulator [Sphingomonas panacisoli]